MRLVQKGNSASQLISVLAADLHRNPSQSPNNVGHGGGGDEDRKMQRKTFPVPSSNRWQREEARGQPFRLVLDNANDGDMSTSRPRDV